VCDKTLLTFDTIQDKIMLENKEDKNCAKKSVALEGNNKRRFTFL
jgi:hypothetical protein